MAIRYAPKPEPRAPIATEKRGRGRPPMGKEIITIRLDADLLAYYRSSGPGWQSRINEALRKAAGL